MELKKKKFRDRKIGKFLKKFAPDVLEFASDLVPDFGALKVVAKVIEKHPTLSDTKKAEAIAIVTTEIKQVKLEGNIKIGLIIAGVAGAFSGLIGISENCLIEILTRLSELF